MSGYDRPGIHCALNGPVEQRVSCPQCAKGDRKTTLGINVVTGVFHCFRCEWKGRTDRDPRAPSTRTIARVTDPALVERKRERLRMTWRETVPLAHSSAHAVRAYLVSRGLGDILKNPPKVLRAHPNLKYWDGTQVIGRFPTLVAMFHDASNNPATLHVTYLQSDGCAKASVPAPKKILAAPVRGATKGGAIRLHEPRNGVLGLAEGIESALSLHLIRKIPVWASFCADNLAHIQLPAGLRELQIGVDIDESGKGEAAAKALAQRVLRWSPRTRVLYVRPELDGPGDLNDEIRRRVS